MAENLNYETSTGSWCYNDSSSNCDKYGRLYNWHTAIKACPAGWHLPSKAEWNDLIYFVMTDEKNTNDNVFETLASKNWVWKGNRGNDIYGFNALPAGSGSNYIDETNTDACKYIGEECFWWCKNRKKKISHAYFVNFFGSIPISLELMFNKYSVRCIKN